MTATLDPITAQAIADSMAQVVANVNGKPVTRGQLNAAFRLVENGDNWKLPVRAVVSLNDEEMALVREAVIFFTGSVPTFTAQKGGVLPRCRYLVRAKGYYAAVGA